MLNPKVAIVARAGTDLRKYGLQYSHAGVVFRDHPRGKWIFTHLLNRCGNSGSELFDEGAVTFFTDTPFQYKALLLIPAPSLQQELHNLLVDGIARQLHEKRYSAIANPGSTKYQNSNQWLLELIAVAKSVYLPPDKRLNAVTLLNEYGYRPEVVKVGFFKRLAASIWVPNIRFDDHDQDARHRGGYPFVSVESIVRFMIRNRDAEAIYQLDLDQPVKTVFEKTTQVPAGRTRRQPASTTVSGGNHDVTAFWVRP